MAPRAPAWDLLLASVAVYLAAAIGRVHELFPVLLPLKPAFVSAAVALALYFLHQRGVRRVGRIRSRTTTLLLALTFWVALSVPFALSVGVAFHLFTDSFLKTVVMCIVIAGAVRGVRDVERLTLAYFVAAAIYAAVVSTRFQLGADDWRLGNLYDYDANDFATLCACALPLGLYFVLGQRRLWLRLIALAGIAVLGIGLIRSGSRGGFLALVAVTGYVLLFFKTLPARTRLLGVVAIVAVIGVAGSDRYWTQMQTILHPSTDYNATEEGGRIKIWERGLGYMASRPLTGVGAGNFQTAEGTLSPLARLQDYGIGVRWGAAHNSFVQAGAELGVPGLALLVGLIASAFAALRRVRRLAARATPPAPAVSRLAHGLSAALVAFVVGGFFLSLAYSDMLYTLVAMAVGLEKIARAELRPAATAR